MTLIYRCLHGLAPPYLASLHLDLLGTTDSVKIRQEQNLMGTKLSRMLHLKCGIKFWTLLENVILLLLSNLIWSTIYLWRATSASEHFVEHCTISGANRHLKRRYIVSNLAPKITKIWHIPNESLECQESGNPNCPNPKYEHFCLQREILKMGAILWKQPEVWF